MQRWDHLLDLGLDGNSDEEWNEYVSNIYQGGISLCDKIDKLVWVYNIKEGLVTAMLAYHSFCMEDSLAGTLWWRIWLWRGYVPSKIKLFVWLCLKNKIMTGVL